MEVTRTTSFNHACKAMHDTKATIMLQQACKCIEESCKSSYISWVAYTGGGNHSKHACDMPNMRRTLDLAKFHLTHDMQEQKREKHAAAGQYRTKLHKLQTNTFHSCSCTCMWRRCFSYAGA